MSFATEDRALSIVAFYSMIALYGDQTLEKTQSLERPKGQPCVHGKLCMTTSHYESPLHV